MLVRLVKRYRRAGFDYLPGAVAWFPDQIAHDLIERGLAVPELEPVAAERRVKA